MNSEAQKQLYAHQPESYGFLLVLAGFKSEECTISIQQDNVSEFFPLQCLRSFYLSTYFWPGCRGHSIYAGPELIWASSQSPVNKVKRRYSNNKPGGCLYFRTVASMNVLLKLCVCQCHQLKVYFWSRNTKKNPCLASHWGQPHWDQRNTRSSECEPPNQIINQA